MITQLNINNDGLLIVPIDFTDPINIETYFGGDAVVEGYNKQKYNGIPFNMFITKPMKRPLEKTCTLPVISKVNVALSSPILFTNIITPFLMRELNDFKSKSK